MLKSVCLVALICLAALAALAAQPPTPDEVAAVRAQGRYLATMTLANGKKFELVLEGMHMPYTVANFIKLAQAKYYDGVPFNYAEKSKGADGAAIDVVMGGDPSGGGPGYLLPLEISPVLACKSGAIVMNRKGLPDSGGSQFILTRSDIPGMSGRYAVFGWVKSGMDIINALAEGDVMKQVAVAPYAGTEACPLLSVATVLKHQPPPQQEIEAVRAQGRYLATLTMRNGKKIELVLEGKEMPITVANFIKLATAKFYDGLTFHRVETDPGFQLIQGGDPNGNGSGSPGYAIRFEKSKLIHKLGALAMARSQDPDSAGCQFYITNCEIGNLDGRYAVFGWVKSGQDVAQAVKKGDQIKSVTIAPYAGTEACPVMGQ